MTSWLANTSSALATHGNPKIANIFLRWDLTEEQVQELAQWDILVLDAEVAVYAPEALTRLKELNPNIILLAYVPSQEIRVDVSDLCQRSFRYRLGSQVPEDWYLKDSAGNKLSWWPGNYLINVTDSAPEVAGQRWNTYLANFVANDILHSGPWDGVLYDNIWEDISWFNNGNIDLNNDGRAEDLSELNSSWHSGLEKIITTTREKAPADKKLILGNGGSTYTNVLAGRLIEHFISHTDSDWSTEVDSYLEIVNSFLNPSIVIANRNLNNVINPQDYQAMRFGLTSTLLGDGYYSFDDGDQGHNVIWWYDEYEMVLGPSKSNPRNLLNPQNSEITRGLWRRDFLYGIVLVNSTSQTQTVTLEDGFEKIHGQQDVAVNDGSLISTVTIPAEDGLILLRRLEAIENTSFTNGSYAKVFNYQGEETRQGFFAYNSNYPGGKDIIVKDIDADGQKETVTASGNAIVIYNANGSKRLSFIPYNPAHNVEPNFAVGDLTGDGLDEIVTGTPRGQGPHVLIFNLYGRQLNPGFFPYPPQTRGGVHVAVGDLNGDQRAEIITGAGYGDGPQIRIYDGNGRILSGGWFAYDRRFRGGVNIGVGDVDGDGKAEIVTGPGYGGGPHIRIFNGSGQLESPGFFAYNPRQRLGIEVVINDINNDGQDEILALTSTVYITARP